MPSSARTLPTEWCIRPTQRKSSRSLASGESATKNYNGLAPGATVWDRLVPVGAMWGNDPDRLNDNGPLEETVINPQALTVVQHLGYNGRLNGPVDDPLAAPPGARSCRLRRRSSALYEACQSR